MVLRNRLKERRAALNVNQQEMGRLCGVSRQTISLIERGDYSPSVTLALKMNNDAIKSANCKALPKFILLTLISTAIGGAVGYIPAGLVRLGGRCRL